jgi:tetratricopeptide (TPR) repeat protein
MKKLLLLFALFLFTGSLFCQEDVDELVKKGIKLHDDGNYIQAIKTYRDASKLAPERPDIYYEISYSYYKLNEFDSALFYSNIAIEKSTSPDEIIIATLMKGSALDCLERTDESISVFKECLNKYGPNYKIYYNLGLDYFYIKDYSNAQEAFINAIKSKNNHISSHYSLGITMNNLQRKCQSMMCLYYFLLYENDSERSTKAYNTIKAIHKSFYGKKENATEIYVSKEIDDGSIVDFAYGMHKVVELKNFDSTKIKEDIFVYNAKSFIAYLNTVKKDRMKDIWMDFYIKFYCDLYKSDNVDAFCNYISSAFINSSAKWLTDNKDKVKKLNTWLKENKY